MRLDLVELRDFRGIPNLVLPIDKTLTVIVGVNGIGKTSILDAISLSLSGFRSLWPDESGNVKINLSSTKPSDISLGKDDFTIKTLASIETTAKEIRSLSLQLCANKRNNQRNATQLARTESDQSKSLTSNEPLFVHYPQNRIFGSNSSRHQHAPISAEEVRNQSLSSDLHAIHDLSSWWDTLDAQEARRHRDEEPGYRDPQLESIRKLVREMEEFESISYEAKERLPGLYLKKAMGPKLHVDQLSSGERAYLILLADLARRLQIVDPDAELANIAGIVLIDEIELNLHPNWQRRILPTLMRVFRTCQFIVTSHSPQILGEIKNGRILVLYKNSDHEIELRGSDTTFGRDANDILIAVLGSSERDEEVKNKLENLEALINRNKLDEARRAIDELRVELGARPIELEIAEQRIRRRERKSKE